MEKLHVRVLERHGSGHLMGFESAGPNEIATVIGARSGAMSTTGPSRTNGAADRGRPDRGAPVMSSRPQDLSLRP
jgi:hypothetical protein